MISSSLFLLALWWRAALLHKEALMWGSSTLFEGTSAQAEPL